jgi:23S rRNA (cytidine1920-2'-O)/16S rRNA (cytidine1409-2'-O)-methyltransferase
MVKPQFEVGRERLGAGGVVRDAGLRRAALGEVAAAARGLGLVLRDAVASPLPGPSGNVEYFLRLSRGRSTADDAGDAVLDRAVEDGPA